MKKSTLLGLSLWGGVRRAKSYAWVQAEHKPLLDDLVPVAVLCGEGF